MRGSLVRLYEILKLRKQGECAGRYTQQKKETHSEKPRSILDTTVSRLSDVGLPATQKESRKLNPGLFLGKQEET